MYGTPIIIIRASKYQSMQIGQFFKFRQQCPNYQNMIYIFGSDKMFLCETIFRLHFDDIVRLSCCGTNSAQKYNISNVPMRNSTLVTGAIIDFCTFSRVHSMDIA